MVSPPETPKKRVYTEETHNASNVLRSPSTYGISDDLTARLQNIGSRVRKSITEGYSTERFALSGYTVPPTPFTSPVKQPSSVKTVTTTPIFRSANDTLQEVFMTPPTSAVALPSPSPSPRKRGRAVLELEDENEDTDYRCNHGEDLVMKMETDPDDEERNVSPSMTPSRPVRRLRKFASSTQPPLPSSDFSVDRQMWP